MTWGIKYMRLNFKEMDIISAVAETQNISKAAAGLSMQQANISKYISDMESRLGLKIFERTSRAVILTEFGRALIPFIRKQIENQKGLYDFISDYKANKNGTVTIYAPTAILCYISTKVIPFLTEMDDICISLKTHNPVNNEYNIGMFFPDDCDIMLSYANPRDVNLISLTLTRGSLHAYASPSYLENHPINSPDELEQHSCILYNSAIINNSNVWTFRSQNEGEKQYRVTGRFICDNALTAIALAVNGKGIVLSPSYVANDRIASGELMYCFKEENHMRYEFVAIYKKREFQPLRVLCVLEQMTMLIRNHFKY